MSKHPLIIALEGPCLAGKTTMIERLRTTFESAGWSVFCVPEYTVYAGGHKNLPDLYPKNDLAAKNNAEFLVDLENERLKDVQAWTVEHYGTRESVVLVDRLLFSCLFVQRRTGDKVGYDVLLQAAKSRRMIVPHLTVFLRISASAEEYESRLSTRKLFSNWEVIYSPVGYEEFFINIYQEILSASPKCYDSVSIDRIIADVYQKALEVIRNGSTH